jgi:hypothetical protein
MTAKMPPTSARAGLLADAAPVKMAGDAVLALVGAMVGRLETLLMVATVVGLMADGAEEAGELAGGAGAAEEDAGAQLAHVADEEAAGGCAEYCDALKMPAGVADDGQGPQVVGEVFDVGETATVVL